MVLCYVFCELEMLWCLDVVQITEVVVPRYCIAIYVWWCKDRFIIYLI